MRRWGVRMVTLARVVRRGRVISGTLCTRGSITMVTASAAVSLPFSVVMGSVMVVIMAIAMAAMVTITVAIPMTVMSFTMVSISMVMITMVMVSMVMRLVTTPAILDRLSFFACVPICRIVTRMMPLLFYAMRVT